MSAQNLESLLEAVGESGQLLRNSQIGAYVYPVVPPNTQTGATSNAPGAKPPCSSTSRITWWNLYVEGPDALKMLSHLAINSFANFPVNRAKQFVPCSYDGYVIGDGFCFIWRRTNWFSSAARPRRTGFSSTPKQAATRSTSIKDDRSPSDPNGKP